MMERLFSDLIIIFFVVVDVVNVNSIIILL